MKDIQVPVLIVGGGGCGLSTSIFLSNLGVDSLLIERHPQQSPMPKARYLNQRTMEVLRQHGLADTVYQRSVPLEYISKMRWCTSLGGDGPWDRKTLYDLEAWGGGSLARTGAEVQTPLLIGTALLLAGGAAVAAGRRRTRSVS